MTVYDSKSLQALLGISDNTARKIMQEYGFRIGYSPKSPLRITEDQLAVWTEIMKEKKSHEFIPD